MLHQEIFPMTLLLLHMRNETLECFACSGKASLGFVKGTENHSAEERKNVCHLSTQEVLIVDSTCVYFAVFCTYLFTQVWKLPLLNVASPEISAATHSPK